MALKLKQKQKKGKMPLPLKQKLFSSLKYFITSWYGYIKLHRWAIVIMGIVILFTGQLFSTNGLILSIGVLLYVLLTYLNKWISSVDKNCADNS